MLQRALRCLTKAFFTQISVHSQHSFGGAGEILVMCVRFLTCCFDTDRPSWVAPEESSYKPEQTNRQKHRKCQKWHNEDNESASLTTELLNAVCGHETWLECWILSPELCHTLGKKTTQSTFIVLFLIQALNIASSTTWPWANVREQPWGAAAIN